MLLFRFVSVFETLLFNAGRVGLCGERRMFETAFVDAVAMLLLFFGLSIAYIIFQSYVWSHQQRRI